MQAFALLATLVFGVSAKLEVDISDKALTWEKPIQKVVRLLNEMSAELEKEAEEDEDMYEKLGCWCDTNEKEKTKASTINTQRITDLTSSIEEMTAKSAQLKVDIGESEKQVAAAETSLEEATSIREKESNEFFESEKDAIQNIESVKGAVMALSKTQDGAALDQESLMQIRQVLQRHFASHKRYMQESSKQHKMVMSLLQTPEQDGAALLQQLRASAPQSGAIFGILKQMKESFETNLAESQKDEETAKQEYAEMKSAKEEEISAGNELIDSKKVELGETDKKNAMAKEDLADTEATLAADTDFLANLKTKCEKAAAEYAARSKVRNEEIKAVSETIGILTDDDAKDLLLKFVQTSSKQTLTRVDKRDRAAKLLQEASVKLHRPRFSQLAVSMKVSGLAEVGEKIGAMIGVLKKEQKDEVAKKDFCVKEIHENEMQTTAKTNAKEDLTQAIADLETSKTTLADEISQLKADISEAQVEMKRASEIRVKENQVFQQTITDAVATQKILAKALAKLESFYKSAAASFLQQRAKASHKKSAGASAVVAMIENIIDESKDEQKQSIEDENEASAAYSAFVADTKASLEALGKSLVNKSEELAGVDTAKAKAAGDLKHTETDLLKLAQVSATLHSECDFVVKFFDIRQSKRGQEIEVLQQAQAIIAGAKL
jgi:hypothetical protein